MRPFFVAPTNSLKPLPIMKIRFHSCALLVATAAFALAGAHAAPPKTPDQKFAQKAAVGGMFEVMLGGVAEKNAESADVKKFGAMMVTDHGKAGEELTAIAGKEGLKLPTKLPAKLQTKVDKISGLTGKAFDAAYVSEMVADHEKDLAAFKAASTSLSDPALKEFAKKTSAVVEKHLSTIKKIQAKMNAKVLPH